MDGDITGGGGISHGKVLRYRKQHLCKIEGPNSIRGFWVFVMIHASNLVSDQVITDNLY